ncbi:MAG: glycosyltransferase, partial [Candidatus Omnitrophica bacterium]|nr:glycosyltransferase [Candidatus Omnitrophota bacterium]
MKISIIVPVYNRIDFIDRCITSILNQSCADFELVIVEDGSTDGTREAVAKYADDPRVKIHLNARNMG